MAQKRNRKSIRLKDYDYAQTGFYFITICTQNRQSLFGNICDRKMIFNDAGEMIKKWFHELANKFPDIECDDCVIMPNHFHGLIVNVGADLRVCPDKNKNKLQGEHTGSPLPTVVQWFKTMTTNEYIHGVKEKNWQPFAGRLWQRNYFERIIRNEEELIRTRAYIISNPLKWDLDNENPDVWEPAK